jgi:hypothetical protein
MASIDISAQIIGDKELSVALARLSSHDIPKAIKAGVRYAARGGSTAIAKNIRASYSLSSARVKQDISSPQFRDGGQTAVLRTSRKPITAMQFKARQTRRGLSMAIYKGQRTVVARGFIAKGLPFQRVGKDRLPLRVIHGPSIHAIYTGGKFAGQIQQATEQRIEERLVTGILRGIRAAGRRA